MPCASSPARRSPEAGAEGIGCALCLAAHTERGREAGLSSTGIALARQGTATDPRAAALIGFALRVLVEPGSLGDAGMAELKAHGWTDRAVADTVGLVSLNLTTGGFNLAAGLEPQAEPPAAE